MMMNKKTKMVAAIVAVMMMTGCGDFYPGNPDQSAWSAMKNRKSSLKTSAKKEALPPPARIEIDPNVGSAPSIRKIELSYVKWARNYEIVYSGKDRREAYKALEAILIFNTGCVEEHRKIKMQVPNKRQVTYHTPDADFGKMLELQMIQNKSSITLRSFYEGATVVEVFYDMRAAQLEALRLVGSILFWIELESE